MKKFKKIKRWLVPSLLAAFVTACGGPAIKTETGVDIPDVPRAVRPAAPVCTAAAVLTRPALRTRRDKTVMNLARLMPRGELQANGIAVLPDTIQSLLFTSKALLNTYYYGFSTASLADLHKKVEADLKVGRPKNLGEYPLQPTNNPAIDKPMTDYFAAIQDGHTGYLPPSAYQGFQQQIGPEPTPTPVFGLQRQVYLRDEGILILDVQAGSPALTVGLRRGDILLELDTQAFIPKADAQATATAYDKIFSDAVAKNQVVNAKYLRKGTVVSVSIKPILLPAAALPWGEVITDSSGNKQFYLRIPTFTTPGLASEVHKLIGVAKTSNVKGVIVDLRDNPGGYITEMVGAVAAFSPNNAVQKFETIDADDETYRYADGKVQYGNVCNVGSGALPITNPNEWTQNVAVLETEYSASGSEYFAQLVKLGGKATVIGEETYGLGNTSAFIVPVTSGRAVEITSGRARNTKGEYLSATVKPDKPAADDLQALINGNDLALNAAFEVLK